MTKSPDPTWRPCPRGELQRLTRRLRRRRSRHSRRTFLWTAGTAATAALLGGALLWSRRESSPKEPLTCSQVQALADAYRKERLSDEVRGQVRRHLTQCPPCRAALSQPMGANQPGRSPACTSTRG